MNQSNSSKQVLLSVIGVAILVVAVVGVSFAFFNYTRTGAANTVRTGQINFTSSQTNLSLNNAFPVTSTVAASAPTQAQIDADTSDPKTVVANPNVAVATVTITGDTSYVNGLDYRITAQAVDFNVEAATGVDALPNIPVRVDVTATGTLGTEKTGTAEVTTDAHNYKLYQYSQSKTDTNKLANGSILAKGHIAPGTVAQDGTYTPNGVNGTFTIKAYLDADAIAISDTYATEGANASPSNENGTTPAWVNGRTVLTTAQWNSLAGSPLTFSIRVESIETTGAYAYNGDGTAWTTRP